MVDLVSHAFCRTCGWHDELPHDKTIAGNPCPKCESGVSTIAYDKDYVGEDATGQKYVEADHAAALLSKENLGERGQSRADFDFETLFAERKT